MDAQLVGTVAAASLSLAGVVAVALLGRRTTREVEGARAQASTNAVILGGVTDLVSGLRTDLARAVEERDACRRELARVKRQRKAQ